MKILQPFIFFILLSFAFIGIIGSPGCANIVPPTGGPRDSLPPVLVSAVPRDGSLNFNSKTIVFTFDEYVQIKDKEKNIIINPMPKTTPTIDYKLKTVTIKIRDTLKPNTTYSIDFGNALGDNNEDNILKNFNYVFSTGKFIDSMTLPGRVIIAKTGRPDSTLIVMLHSNLDDSAVAKERPRYVTRVDSLGNFFFKHLAPGTYRIYALKDESGTRTYTSKSMVFAFGDTPVVVQPYPKPIMLFAYADESEPKLGSKKSSSSTTTPPPKPAKPAPEKNRRLQFQTNAASGEFDVLDTFKLLFTTGLKTFDSTKFRFTDEQFNDINNYQLIRDSSNTKISLIYKWALETKYHIVADKEFAEDSAGRKLLKTDTINFQTKRESQYGEVHLRFMNIDLSKNPVLLFIQNDAVKYSYTFVSRDFQKILFEPGEYDLRILYDDNKNGVWDPGDFYKHRQPEKVERVKFNNTKKKLTVRPNWNNDFDYSF